MYGKLTAKKSSNKKHRTEVNDYVVLNPPKKRKPKYENTTYAHY